MKAFILAAGLGTRLRPITEYLPKPIVPILGITALEICYKQILKTGIKNISVNIHHLAPVIKQYIEYKNIECNISIEMPDILGTGGGLGKLKKYFNGDNVLIYNADVVSDIDLKKLIDYHCVKKKFATLALVKNKQTDGVMIDDNNCIIDFNNPDKTGFTFSGISVVSKEIYNNLPENDFFNIIDLYKQILLTTDAAKIQGVFFENAFWSDIGSISSYWLLTREIAYSESLQHKFFIQENNNELRLFRQTNSVFINSILVESIKNSIVLNNTVIFADENYRPIV